MEKTDCRNCKGLGNITVDPSGLCMTCPHCKGDRQLDWLENMLGKKNEDDGFVYAPYMPVTVLPTIVHPKLVSRDMVSVQPMDKPSSQIYFNSIDDPRVVVRKGGRW